MCASTHHLVTLCAGLPVAVASRKGSWVQITVAGSPPPEVQKTRPAASVFRVQHPGTQHPQGEGPALGPVEAPAHLSLGAAP